MSSTPSELLTQTQPHAGPSDSGSALAALKVKLDQFLDLAQAAVEPHPWLVVIAMHEYFRTIYPADPYVGFDERQSPPDRVRCVLDSCIGLLEAGAPLGSYFADRADCMAAVLTGKGSADSRRPDEGPTQQVYGRLWDDFDNENYLAESVELLQARLRNSGLEPRMLAGKVVLDLGCGSGRHAMAMAMAGAQLVHGVDLGATSLETARSVAGQAGLENIVFRVGDALNLPYDDHTFDFVWCNGVLHHTSDLHRGINELYRVLKPASQAFLYLYGDGGLFWYSRKRMRPIMQRIGHEYAMAVLDIIGTPHNRFIFADSWYVPIEQHTGRAELERFLSRVGFCTIRKVIGTRPTDLDRAVDQGGDDATMMWGDGEHRYLVTKG